MEQSKGLIVLISALALVTLVVLVGLFFFYPRETAPTAKPAVSTAPPEGISFDAAPSTKPSSEFDPVEWTRSLQEELPGLASGQTQTEKPQDDGFIITMEGDNPPAATGPGRQAAGQNPTASAQTPASQSKPQTETVKPAPVAVKPVAPVKTIRVKEMWIQVAAYKDRYAAEAAQKALESNGLKGTLMTATSGGATVVRVRVGPYANKAEAEKFLAWIKPVKGFDGAFITEAWTTKTVQ